MKLVDVKSKAKSMGIMNPSSDRTQLVRQIQKRGRDYEASIRLDYLKSLNDRYESWIETYKHGKLLIVDVDNINFSDNPEDLGMIIDKVNAELHGLF